MFLLLLTACVTDEPEADTTETAPEACISPVIIDYTCNDGSTYTFPDALPVMATLLVEYADGSWQTKGLTVRPNQAWSVDVTADSFCGVDISPAVVGGRLVLAFE